MNFWKYAKVYRPREIYQPRKGARLAGEDRQRWQWFVRRANQMRNNPTPLEIKLELVLDSLNVNHKRQHIIGDFIVDFYLPAYRVVIEADGYAHESHVARKRDTRRDKILIKQYGCRVLHLRRHEFYSAETMQTKIMEFLTRVDLSSARTLFKEGVTAPAQEGLNTIDNRGEPA